MATYKFDKVSQKMVLVSRNRFSDTAAPYVQADEIEPTESWATNKREIFTSKSALRRHYKEHGFRETGGDHINYREITTPELGGHKEDIEKAYYDVKYGRVEFSEKEKETHKREERAWGSKYKVKSPY